MIWPRSQRSAIPKRINLTVCEPTRPTNQILNPHDLDRARALFVFREGGAIRILFLEAFAQAADHDHVLQTDGDLLSACFLPRPAPPLLLSNHAETGI